MAFGGELGILYISNYSDVIKLTGHFKPINEIKYIKWQEDREMLENLVMTASDDFSVRIWHTGIHEYGGVQLLMFLDLNQTNSEVICIDWHY